MLLHYVRDCKPCPLCDIYDIYTSGSARPLPRRDAELVSLGYGKRRYHEETNGH